MDCHQVTSRALYEEDDVINHVNQVDAENGDLKTGADLEKHQTAASTASYQETYPEGGLQAWSVVAGSWFSLFASLGLMNTLGTFQAYVLDNQLTDYSEGTVGWVFSIYTFLAFFCGVYIGPVFDKYGPRWLVIAGAVFTVGGMIFMSFATQLWHFVVAFGLLCGFGSSLLFTPSIAAVGHFFKARRGLATGVASTAGGIGGIVYPFLLTRLIDKIGYGWATRVIALICLVCSLIGIGLLKSRLPPAKDATAHPNFRIFKSLPFLFTTIGVFLLEFSLFIPLGFISTYALHKGFGKEFSYNLIPILNAGSVIGRILPGYYADVIGPFNVSILAVILAIVACFCVWLPLGGTTAGVIIFTVLFGFSSGTSIAIAPVCIGRLCKTQEYGRYYATAYTIVSFACLIGIPIGGSTVQANGGEYWGLIIMTGAIYVGSMISLFLAKVTLLGWSNWKAAL
ncbi:major facilitator superfamily domain-containing protein [Fusarium flagelliforme]|uniref:Mfs monocarboxylate transporter n=1 Tax=Fusarium flagelliforme TaxID=2675880 RepID=A0A395MH49_9HYPO|nr:major facilitator superfamily domain-containing protein [Fusarium flagelliforme]KAH7185425.1 major facilitator superfamily domain-containing protein [Fusarium flagelliforme]RFN47171.1 mfs monocarboxylate transporter [Fusarium flagelliforme]